jgi:hypothetical protein
MTINVVKDPAGNLIASFETAAAGTAQVQPVLPAGHKVEQLAVQTDYKSNLSALYSTKAAKS